MTTPGQVRWGIIGTANIARAVFLPGLRQAGGDPAAVAGRDAARAGQFARDNEHPSRGRRLPEPHRRPRHRRALHSAAQRAARRVDHPRARGRASRCCARSRSAARSPTPSGCSLPPADRDPALGGVLVSVPRAVRAGQALVADGEIGELMEINPTSTSSSAPGQHPVLPRAAGRRAARRRLLPGPARPRAFRLRARVRLGAGHVGRPRTSTWTPGACSTTRPGGGCCCRAASAAATTRSPRWKAPSGQIHLSNPFHPGPADSYQIIAGRAEPRTFPAAPDELSFTAIIRHINAVLRGEQEPRLLATDTALAPARALHELAESAERHR